MILLVAWSMDNIHEARRIDNANNEAEMNQSYSIPASDDAGTEGSAEDRIQRFPDRVIQDDEAGTTTIIYENDGTIIINHEMTHSAKPVVTVVPWPDH